MMRRLDGKPPSNTAPEGEIRTVKNGKGGTYKRIKQNGKWVTIPKPREEWNGQMQKYAHLKPNQCTICGEIKPEEEFPKLTFTSKRNPDKIYRRRECKSCFYNIFPTSLEVFQELRSYYKGLFSKSVIL